MASRRSDRKVKKRFRTDATEVGLPLASALFRLVLNFTYVQKFVIVKPPPGATASHPLQVQFVPPAHALESRSCASLSSASTSTTSVNSTSSSFRRIIPLYNFQNHALQASAIHDAGTDDKVSRFAKHGIEVLDVGLFEPVEVWGSCPIDFEDDAPRGKAGTATGGLLDIQNVLADIQRNDRAEENGHKDGGVRRFFGRLFQPKPQSSSSLKANGNHNPAIYPSQSARGSASGSPSPPLISSNSNAHPEHVLPSVLGTVPLLQSLTVPPQGRPSAYVFVTRKWNKSSTENWLQQTMLHNGDTRCEIDLRFEWTRSTERRSGFRKPPGSGFSHQPSPLSRPVSLAQLNSQTDGPVSSPGPPARQSPTSDSRPGSSYGLKLEPPDLYPPNSLDSHLRQSSSGCVQPSDLDTEDESDPEDSEVPWICTLVVRPRSAPSRAPSPPSESPHSSFSSTRLPPLRLKVACLAPAPHHPKVIAQLKCPYPLPDVDLVTAALVQRDELPGVPDSAPQGRHMLSAEEIKDIVCSTGIWLVVREGFGGLGKKSRGKTRPRT